MRLLIDRIERHDLVNAAALAGTLLIMGFLLLGARSALGSVWERGLFDGEKVGDEFATIEFDDDFGLRPPNEVSVAVGNASGIDGKAGRATELLTSKGYGELPPQTKAGETLAQSVVYYIDGFIRDAVRVAEILNVDRSQVRPLPDSSGIDAEGADVVVLFGADGASSSEEA